MSRFRFVVIIVLLVIAASFRVWMHRSEEFPKNQPIKFEATIKREVRDYDTYQVVYIADSRIYADLYPRYQVGDRLLVAGEFDDEGRMFNGKVEKVGEKSTFSTLRSKFRERISEKISQLLPAREAALVVGTILGVDTISAEFRDELIRTGTIHVVVVSGQNLMIVAGIFLSLARYIGRRQSMILAILAVFAYAFLTGFEPPVIRASIMVLASTVAIFLGREADVLWTLIIAALVMILVWPQALFEVSFQLTFSATLGIVTLGRWFMNFFKGPVSSFLPTSARSKLKSNSYHKEGVELRAVGIPFTAATLKNLFSIVLSIAAIPVSAFVFTAPVILVHFSKVSLISPIANILVAEAVFPIMILGFLIAIAALIFMPFAQVLAYLAFVPAFYFSEIVRILSNF